MHTKDRLAYESMGQIQTLNRGTWVFRELLRIPHNFAVYLDMAGCRKLDTVNTISKSSATICVVLGFQPEFPPRRLSENVFKPETLRLTLSTLQSIKICHDSERRYI
ncbi:hypothetical protein AYI69_g4208 [Smittium culicis]|uniref:Uncharacterized protein n=1 Tax=Smittium culicis TaxID=133412 RepID=A0A1R1YFW3_9FUNG|nr:hypothetical protein AYI69_g4208 [Smittium culicis]